MDLPESLQGALERAVKSLSAKETRLFRHAVDRYLEGLEAPKRELSGWHR